MWEAMRADAKATRGVTVAEYTKALQERHKLYNIWEEEKKKHAELEAIGYSEWPTFQVVSEYIVMDMFRENLGTGIKLESFTPKQQKLLDFLRENEIDTYMERFAGIKTDQSF